MKYIFRKSINFFINENVIIFDNTKNKKRYKLVNLNEKIIDILKMIQLGFDEAKILEKVDIITYDETIKFLIERDLIRKDYKNSYLETKFEKQIDYYSEFFENPETIPQILKNKKVLVVGLGGVGCVAIQHLLGAGIQNFICIDNDKVQASNMNRQFCYTRKDIGKFKTEVMKEYIFSMESDAKVVCYNEFVNSSEQLKWLLKNENSIDFILCCADKPPIAIKNYIIEYAIEKSIPFSFVGIGVHDGIWGPLIFEKSIMEKFRKINDKIIVIQNTVGEGIITPSIGFTNTIVSTFFVNDIIMYLAGFENVKSKNKILNINFIDNSIRTILHIQ